MNYIDGILIVLLLAMVIVGSRKGLIRESMAFLIFFAALIASISYVDIVSVWIFEKLGGSPLVSALLAFVFLLAVSYAVFKLLGMLFYRIAQIKEAKKRDQMGGALVGFVRGWLAVAFLTFLVFLLPMPAGFYADFEKSMFGPTVAKTVPFIYNGTSPIHPEKRTFMEQMEHTLLHAPVGGQAGKDMLDDDRRRVHEVLRQIDLFFNVGT